MLSTMQHNRGLVTTAAAPRAHVSWSPVPSYVPVPNVCTTWTVTAAERQAMADFASIGHKLGTQRLEERST